MSREPRRCCVCDHKEQPREDFHAHERACIEAEWAKPVIINEGDRPENADVLAS